MDEGILSREGGMPPVYLLPIVMPTRPRASVEREREIVFVGGFAHHPNLDGICWFMKEIWPNVHKEVPNAQLTVIGSKAPPEVMAFDAMPGVKVVGFVPETDPYLDRAAISVAPLRYGAGMKGKVIEAMASGLPVVTTSVGAQGIKAVSGEHLMIADEPADFARTLITLLQDSARGERLGLAGQKHVAGLCGPEVVEQNLEQMLRMVVPRRRPVRSVLRWSELSLKFRAKSVLPSFLHASAGSFYRQLRRRNVAKEQRTINNDG
jgi:glycosyltransferase involved in cell wall biosynthesis